MTPEQIATAIAALITGSTQVAAAAAAGVPESTLRYNLTNKAEITNLIKTNQTHLIQSSLTKAIQNQIDKITISSDLAAKFRDNKDLPAGYKTYAELGTRAEEKLLESVGIHPSHTQSISLTQIMIDARSELSPAVERLLGQHLQGEVTDLDRATIGPKEGDKV